MPQITVYSKSACPNCETVKKFLKQKNLKFNEISLDNPEMRASFMAAYPGVRTMPQVIVNDVRVENLHNLADVIAAAA